MPKLASRVPVQNPDTNVVEWFGPDDDLPEWVNEETVTNPAAWAEAPEPVDTAVGTIYPDDNVRRALLEAAEDAGVEVPENANSDAIARLIRLGGEADAAVPSADFVPPAPSADEDVDLEGMSKDELYDYGQANDVHVTRSMSKAELIEAIETD